MSLNQALKPSPLSKYKDLIPPGDSEIAVTLSQEEQAVLLKTHDFGIAMLTSREVGLINSIASKFKDKIWP